MSSKTKNSKVKKRITDNRSSRFFLFSAAVNKSGAIVDGTMELITDRVFLSENTRLEKSKRADANLVPWCSDSNGLIRAINTQKTDGNFHVRAHCPQRMKFIFPPTDLALYAYAAEGKVWDDAIAEAVHEAIKDKKVKYLERGRTRFDHRELKRLLRKPVQRIQGQNDPDEAYRKWYDKHSADNAKDVRGYVIPNVRAIFFIFTSDLFLDSEITIFLPEKKNGNKKKVRVRAAIAGDASFRFFLTCYTGNSKKLVDGIYTVKVDIADGRDPDKLRFSHTFIKSKSFTFKTHVTFDSSNAAGSYAVVMCDPVSVEEAMMMQFPKEFVHLLEAAKGSNVDMSKFSGEVAQSFGKALPAGLKPWSERLGVSKTIMSNAASMLEADSRTGLYKAMGRTLWDVVSKSAHTDVKNMVDMVFGVADAKDTWDKVQELVVKGVVKTMNSKRSVPRLAEAALTDLFKLINRKDFKGITASHINNNLVQSHAKWKLKLIDFKENKVLQANRAARVAKKMEKVAKFVQAPLTIYSLCDAVNTMTKNVDSADKADGKLEELCGLYIKELCEPKPASKKKVAKDYTFYPCREATSHLEKMRNRAMIYDLKLKEDTQAAVMALHDVVLAGMALVPATAPIAGLVLVVEECGKLVYNFGKTAFSCLDQLFVDSAMTQFLKDRKVFTDIFEYYAANTRRMVYKGFDHDEVDLPENHLYLQYRLRAEVLYGLFWLIATCAVNVDEDNTLESNLDKYKVHQYIQNFLLNDGWAFSLFPMTEQRMHTVWLYKINNGEDMDSDEFEDQGLDKNYLLIKKSPKGPAWLQRLAGGFHDGTLLADYTNFPGLRPAAFQSCFPIHVMDSKDITDFAGAFKTIHKELDADCIAYTEIYYRERGASPTDPWKPVMDVIKRNGNAPKSLSPYHQIRVLIVLKKDGANGQPIKGIYPVLLELNRLDGFDISEGPKYKGLTRILTNADQPSGSSTTPWAWAGHYGCIIEPFFDLYGAYVPGTKPMGGQLGKGFSSGNDLASAKAYYDAGHMENMKYGFMMTIGNNLKTGQLVRVQSKWSKVEKPNWITRKFESIGIFSQPVNRRVDYPVSIDLDRRYPFDKDGNRVDKNTPKDQWLKDEDRFLSRHLFTLRTKSSTYPPLFVKDKRGYPYPQMFTVPLMRLGHSSDYLPPLEEFAQNFKKTPVKDKTELKWSFKEERSRLVVNNFDWETPVSFIFLVASRKIDPSQYINQSPDDEDAKYGLDWKTIPFSVTPVETESGTMGPEISTRLHYVGQAIVKNQKFVLDNKEKIPWDQFPKLAPLKKLIENETQLTNLMQPMKASEYRPVPELHKQWDDTYAHFHLFAAYFNMSYESPTGRTVESMRPFGKDRVDLENPVQQKYNELYSFAFRNVRTAKDSGFTIRNLNPRDGDSLLNINEYKFQFSGVPKGFPYNYPGLAWMKPPKAPKAAKQVDLKIVKKWIEEKPEALKLCE